MSLDIYNVDNVILSDFIKNKYINNTLKPTLNNNFKKIIPEVNIIMNSGKKILFFLYEIAGMILLKLIGAVLYLKVKRCKDK